MEASEEKFGEPEIDEESTKKFIEENPRLKRTLEAAKEPQQPSIEWDGIMEDVGLSGVVIRPVDEHKLWATKNLFANKSRVHVTVVKQ